MHPLLTHFVALFLLNFNAFLNGICCVFATKLLVHDFSSLVDVNFSPANVEQLVQVCSDIYTILRGYGKWKFHLKFEPLVSCMVSRTEIVHGLVWI